MTIDPAAYDKLMDVAAAISVLSGLCAWWRKGSDEEDAMVSEAADTVIDAVADADTMRAIELGTGINLRDQLSVEEAMNMHEERTLRRFGRRN